MTWLITSAVTNALVVIPLAMIAYLVARYSKRPALAHLVWAGVLVKLLTPPIITIPLPWQIDPQALLAKLNTPPPTLTVAEVKPVPPPTLKLQTVAAKPQPKQGSVVHKPSLAARTRTTKPDEPKIIATRPLTTPMLVLYSIGGLWVLGGVFLATRTLYLAWRFQRSLQKSRSDEFLNIRMGRIAQAAGFSNWPEVVLLDGVFSPMLWGMGRRAKLVFPTELAARLDRAASDTLLLHELAHYSRGDHWIRLLEIAAKTLFWWHPVVWIALKGIEAAEEECCDAWVIERQHSPRRTYAEALLATIDFLNEQSVALPPVATGLGEISLLRRRLTQIMRNEATIGLSPAGRMTVIVLALLIAPIGPAVFASSPRVARRPKPPMPLIEPTTTPVEVSSSISSGDPGESEPAETPQPEIPTPRIVQSLTNNTPTPWIPPALWATALSPDGRYKLEARSGRDATRVTLSNLSDGFKVDLSSDGIQCVSFAGDARFTSGHQDGNVRVWDSSTGGIALNLKGSDAAITSVAFTRDGNFVAAGNANGEVLVWDATPSDDRTRYPRYELEQQESAIACVRWSESGDRLAISVTGWNETFQPALLVWSSVADKITQRLSLDRPAGAIAWLGGDSVLIANWDGMASVRQLTSGEVTSRIELDKNALSAAAWSPDCPLLPRQRAQGLLQLPE
jgi:beta-lactamase regulating signal transducer with metallopeptidase domain